MHDFDNQSKAWTREVQRGFVSVKQAFLHLRLEYTEQKQNTLHLSYLLGQETLLNDVSNVRATQERQHSVSDYVYLATRGVYVFESEKKEWKI